MNSLYQELENIIRELKPGFYGTIEVGVQNSIPGTVKITQSYRLDKVDSVGHTRRGAINDNTSRQ